MSYVKHKEKCHFQKSVQRPTQNWYATPFWCIFCSLYLSDKAPKQVGRWLEMESS